MHATHYVATQDPCLDDGALLAQMETRLSRESGADRNNQETFGDSDCASGWSFEEEGKEKIEIWVPSSQFLVQTPPKRLIMVYS